MAVSPRSIFNFYLDGFRSMTVGRRLWLIIIIKLVVMFAILKVFFFPDLLGQLDSDAARSSAVRSAVIEHSVK